MNVIPVIICNIFMSELEYLNLNLIDLYVYVHYIVIFTMKIIIFRAKICTFSCSVKRFAF
jgi:hypothetical protein